MTSARTFLRRIALYLIAVSTVLVVFVNWIVRGAA